MTHAASDTPGSWRPAFIAAMMLTGCAWAGDPPEGDVQVPELLTPTADRYKVRFEPAVYYAAPGGRLTMPGSPSGTPTLKLEDVGLDEPRASPYGELSIRSGDWRVAFSGFAVGLDDVGTIAPGAMQIGPLAIAAGDLVSSSVDIATGEFLIGRQLGAPDSISGKTDPDFAVSFEAFGGARFYNVAFDFAAPAGVSSTDGFFLQPVGGAKVTMNIIDRIDIDVQGLVGGMYTGNDTSSFSIEIITGFTYRPVEYVGVQVGYRMSFFDLQSGSGVDQFKYTGAVAGLFAGVVIRF